MKKFNRLSLTKKIKCIIYLMLFPVFYLFDVAVKAIKGLMKNKSRIIAATLAFIMLVSVIPLQAYSVDKKEILYGDVNDDAVVNQEDVTALKKFLAEYDININEDAADVNTDGKIDMEDLLILEKYVAGLDVIVGERVTVTFDSCGGTPVYPVEVKKGFAIKKVPVTSKEGFTFLGWYTSDNKPFYAEDLLNSDITLYAKYEEMASKEQLSLTSFALEDQLPTVSFTMVGSSELTLDDVKNKISFVPMDGSSPVETEVFQSDINKFTFKAKDKFTPGCSYQITISEGLNFDEKPASIRTASFTIHKDEVDKLSFSKDVIYIKDTDSMNYLLKGASQPVPVLESALLNSQTDDAVEGTFEYDGGSLSTGNILCIYENADPRTRDYINNDYTDDSSAFVEVINVVGKLVAFRTLDDEDAKKVIFIPDTIPYSVASIPTGDSGIVNSTEYDLKGWNLMGYTGVPKFDVGDFLVLYQGNFAEIDEQSTVYYAKVVSIDGNAVSYVKSSKTEIESALDLFLENPISGDKLLENADTQKLEGQIENQVQESGFADDAATYLAEMATKTEGFKSLDNLTELTVKDSSGKIMSSSQLMGLGGSIELSEKVKVKAEIGSSTKYFTGGLRLALSIEAEFSADVGEDGELKILLNATFVEEVSIKVDVKANAKVKWYFIVPVLKELTINTAVDLKNYAGISLDVKVYTLQKEEESEWAKLKQYKTKYKSTIEKIEELQEKINQAKETVDKLNGYKADIQKLWAALPAGTELDYKNLLKTLGELNVSEELLNLLNLTSKTELDAGVKDLMQRYSEMLKNESEWITLLQKEIFSKDFRFFGIIAVGLKVDFVIRADVNIALGANMEYVMGKRYSFWVDVIKFKSGSSTMDLLDEKFAFQFYVMGSMGIKMGVRAEIRAGLFSTKLASLGFSAEFGPYVKLWGYFVYEYSKMRPANTNTWLYDERMAGALYIDFGLYLIISFNAQAFGDAFSYSKDLLNTEIPLLKVGTRKHVYTFGNEIDADENIVIKDEDDNSTNGITMKLPESYRLMQYIDLLEGNIEKKIYPYNDFAVTLSNRNFSLDQQTGIISVNVPEGVQYMKCDLTLTWKDEKLAFSSFDISLTLPLVWTNLSSDELKQKFTASVKVGNPQDGYITVWSDRVNKNQPFNLPSKAEIQKLIGYSVYDTAQYGNLKYSSCTGYTTQHTDNLAIYADTDYYFDVTPRKYALILKDVQQKDGSLKNITLSAKYGESFDLATIRASGADNSRTGSYTSFIKVISKDNSGNEITRDISRMIDIGFAKEILSGTEYKAVYADNSVKVTYKFEGVNIEDKTVVIKKGTTPPDVFTEDVTAKNAIVTSISPALGNILSSTVYTVTCKVQEKPIIKYTVTYQTNGGTVIEPQEYPEGSTITAPGDPVRTGYDFGGWYSNKELTNSFVFDKMPSENITVYAKWTGKNYTVKFDGNEGSLPKESPNPVTVTYGDTYGVLPIPTRTGYSFKGWFTARTGGSKVTGSDTVVLTDSITLFAQWQAKAPIQPGSVIAVANQSYVYNKKHQPLVFSCGDIPADSFILEYKRQGIDDSWKPEAVNAGMYDVKITRLEDDRYLAFEKTISAAMSITKAESTISAPTATFYYGNIIVNPLRKDIDYVGDGKIRYAIGDDYNENLDAMIWQSSNMFNNVFDLDAGYKIFNNPVYIYANIMEGENYKAATSVCIKDKPVVSELGANPVKITPEPVSAQTALGNYTFKVRIKTSNINKAGTDANIYCALSTTALSSANKDEAYKIDSSSNDFEKGTTGEYNLKFSSNLSTNDSWYQIPVQLLYVKKGTSAGWHCEWIAVDVYKNGKLIQKGTEQSVNMWFGAEENDSDVVLKSFWLGDYRRSITNEGNFNSFPSEIRLTSSDIIPFEFEYDANITDQYGTYMAYSRFSAPSFTVSADKTGFEPFYGTRFNVLTIDKKGLYQAMMEKGVTELNLKTMLSFPAYSVKDNCRTYTRTITIKCSDAAGKTDLLKSSIPMYLQSSGQYSGAFSAVAAQGQDGTVDVTLKVKDNAGIWGMKAAIEFDTSVLTLVSSTAGNVFSSGEITPPQSLLKSRYVFLASRADFSDTKNNGNLVTLTFKIKDGALITDYPITLKDIQAVNSQGSVIGMNVSTTAPKISVSGNTADIKMSDKVTITASANNSTVKAVWVKKDSGEFADITSVYNSGYTVTENGSYIFKAESESGEIATSTLIYSNIDGKKPVVVVDSGSYKADSWTKENVVLSISNTVSNLGVTAFMYKCGNGEWTSYTNPLVVSEANETVYSFKAISQSGVESDVITYTVKRDVGMPSAEIKIGENKWNSFLNTITFGLFFNKTQTVVLSGTDTQSGIAKIEYKVASGKVDNASEINDWTEYKDSFNLNPNSNSVIYVKVTDNAGNSVIINSDGIVIDNVIPVIKNIKDGATYCSSQIAEVSDDNLLSVTVNDKAVELTNGKFTLSPASGAQKVVVTDKAGNTVTITVTVNDGHTWNEGKVTKEPTTTTEGEKTYTCKYCDTAKVEKINKLKPDITEGTNAKWIIGSNQPLVFKTNAAAADFVGVTVDGKKLTTSEYALKDDGTVIELNAEYLATLDKGVHTISIDSTTGSAVTEFTIEAEGTGPITGDTSNLTISIMVLLLSGAIMVFLGLRKKPGRKPIIQK